MGGAASQKTQEASSSSSTGNNSTATPTEQSKALAGPSQDPSSISSKPEPTSVESQKPAAPSNPFQQLGVKAGSGAASGISSGGDTNKRPASDLDGRVSTLPTAPRKLASKEEAIDVFADRVLEHVFRVTVDPDRHVDVHGHRLTFLPGASAELQDAGQPLTLSAADLDSVLLEACTAWPHDKPLLSYLLPCWKRVIRALGAVKEAQQQKREVLIEAKRLCMSNCLFALTLPDLFGYVNSPPSSPGRRRSVRPARRRTHAK